MIYAGCRRWWMLILDRSRSMDARFVGDEKSEKLPRVCTFGVRGNACYPLNEDLLGRSGQSRKGETEKFEIDIMSTSTSTCKVKFPIASGAGPVKDPEKKPTSNHPSNLHPCPSPTHVCTKSIPASRLLPRSANSFLLP
jgi:hypothetical protein